MVLKTFYRLARHKVVLPLILIIVIELFSLNAKWVENLYSTGFFKPFSIFLRTVTAWLPFSAGDAIYLIAGGWVVFKSALFVIGLFERKVTAKSFLNSLKKLLVICLWVYIVFILCWGLNYSRRGIASQLHFTTTKYDSADLKNIVCLLILKVNETRKQLTDHPPGFLTNEEIFDRARDCYTSCGKIYPFLRYRPSSIKSSIFSWAGNYVGFTGYYNPFTGEAQVNTTVPRFLIPYTACHEIAHQLGYAKENEANFVGYLAIASSNDTLFQYSAYLDLFEYAIREMFFKDPFFAFAAQTELLPEVRSDIRVWRQFVSRHKSIARPIANWAYAKFLLANHQPKGLDTYNEVIADLIAFYKKYGRI